MTLGMLTPDQAHALAEAPKEYWYGGGSVGYSDWPGMNGRVAAGRS